jgi:hypothetical protein
VASKKTNRTSKKAAPKTGEQPHRKAVVLVSLVGVLTLTTGLLVALSPDPLDAADRGPTLLNANRTPATPVAHRPDTRSAAHQPRR